MNRRHSRIFRPSLTTECLESRRLLDAAADYALNPTPTDQAYDDLDAELDNLYDDGSTPAQIQIVSMQMEDKDALVAGINAARDRFNASVDTRIAGMQKRLGELQDTANTVFAVTAQANAAFQANPADPALEANALKWGQLSLKAQRYVNGETKAITDQQTFKADVNKLVDQVINDILGTVYTMQDPNDPTGATLITWTVYSNDPLFV